MPPHKPLSIGSVFGELTVIDDLGMQPSPSRTRRLHYARVRCSCGEIFGVLVHSLRTSNTKKCGPDHIRAMHKNVVRMPEYRIWSSIKQRCFNPNEPNFRYYGGRGITICSRWLDFKLFLADVGLRPNRLYSIDRIDVDGNYEPGNCRWMTRREQDRNKRANRWIEFEGERLVLQDWADRFGVRACTLIGWLRKMPSDEALTKARHHVLTPRA